MPTSRRCRRGSGVTVDVVVLNGGSSSGKTSIGRCLQELLPRPWLLVGADDLIDVAPSSVISYGPQGEVVLGEQWRALEAAWSSGVAAMARAGAGVIIDDVFLEGALSQRRTGHHLEGLNVLWVGVRCASEVATARELVRGGPAGGDGSQAGRGGASRCRLRRCRGQRRLLSRGLRPSHRGTGYLTPVGPMSSAFPLEAPITRRYIPADDGPSRRGDDQFFG